MEEQKMLSLYDYLKHAAGSQLGKEVATKAAEMKVGFEIKHVSNPKYTGEVMMYPESFLNWYFKKPDADEMRRLVNELNELPF
jgi:hypothetical protein